MKLTLRAFGASGSPCAPWPKERLFSVISHSLAKCPRQKSICQGHSSLRNIPLDLVQLARFNNHGNAILGNINPHQRTIVDGAGEQEVGQLVVDLLLH